MIHVEGWPRPASNCVAPVQTARKTFCTTSAASSRSRTIRAAREYAAAPYMSYSLANASRSPRPTRASNPWSDRCSTRPSRRVSSESIRRRLVLGSAHRRRGRADQGGEPLAQAREALAVGLELDRPQVEPHELDRARRAAGRETRSRPGSRPGRSCGGRGSGWRSPRRTGSGRRTSRAPAGRGRGTRRWRPGTGSAAPTGCGRRSGRRRSRAPRRGWAGRRGASGARGNSCAGPYWMRPITPVSSR